jgi:osmoprotectant transport system permease protein
MIASALVLDEETSGWARLDKLGVLIAAGLGLVLFFAPFVTFAANRIVLGEGLGVAEALPGAWAYGLVLASVAVALIAVVRSPVWLRLSASLAGIALLAVCVGAAASGLVEEGDTVARVSPASGFWLLFALFGLLAMDALARLKLPPIRRILLVVLAGAALAICLGSGLWNDLSVMREYQNRAASFGREAERHLFLALGSLGVAALVGIPLGILCHEVKAVRGPVLGVLNILQTVPSIALFGLLIAPLSWLSNAVPVLRDIGISGIGAAPAFIALFFYSLLPVVANTVVGLAGVSPAVTEAAAGMGMTERQRLFRIKLPLAFPVILTGIRIVLVQNIGLATIAALIGGGGFGVFVFQGVGQTAMDLVLLGALPTVALALAAAVLLDAIIDMVRPAGLKETAR